MFTEVSTLKAKIASMEAMKRGKEPSLDDLKKMLDRRFSRVTSYADMRQIGGEVTRWTIKSFMRTYQSTLKCG